LLFIFGAGVEQSPLLLRWFIGLLYQPWMMDDDCGMNEWQGKPKYSEKTYSSAALSTTDHTWLDPDSNQGRRDGKPATTHIALLVGIPQVTMGNQATTRLLSTAI
jgi:hypothetical protein